MLFKTHFDRKRGKNLGKPQLEQVQYWAVQWKCTLVLSVPVLSIR